MSSTDIKGVQIDQHDLVLSNQLSEIEGRSRLADDAARDLAARVLVDLRLDRVDDLLAMAQLQRLEVAAEPVPDRRVGGPLEHAVPKPRNAEQVGHFEHRVLRSTPMDGVRPTDRLVGLEQGHEREPKGVLHARPPEGVELPLEDAQRVADCLIAIPAQANIQEVHAERALTVGDIKVDDVGAPLERHQRQRRRGQVTVWIDQDDAALVGT